MAPRQLRRSAARRQQLLLQRRAVRQAPPSPGVSCATATRGSRSPLRRAPTVRRRRGPARPHRGSGPRRPPPRRSPCRHGGRRPLPWRDPRGARLPGSGVDGAPRQSASHGPPRRGGRRAGRHVGRPAPDRHRSACGSSRPPLNHGRQRPSPARARSPPPGPVSASSSHRLPWHSPSVECVADPFPQSLPWQRVATGAKGAARRRRTAGRGAVS